MKFFRTKLTVFFGLLLAVLYFTNDFALIDIEKTAIVVAIGIDRADDGGYEVTAQIAVPQATDTASSNDDAIMTSKGKTVWEAIDNIGSDTGWHPKMSFCSMIFFGRDLANDNIESVVDCFIRSDKIQNSAIVAMSDTKAADLLFAKTPLDAISSFALQKIVLKNEWMVSTVGVTNLKQFAISNYSKSKSAYMPVISIIHGKTKGKDQSGGLAPASTGGEKTGGEDEQVIFDASEISLFSGGVCVGQLSKEQTLIYYLFQGPVYDSFISVDDEDGTRFLTVSGNRYSVTVDTKKPSIELKLELTVESNDSTSGTDLKNFTANAVLNEKTLYALKQKIYKTAYSLTEKLSAADADIFSIKEYIYKYKNSDYERLKNLPLSEFEVNVDVKVKSKD